MIPLLSADEMRQLEHDAIQGWGVPSLVLQEHAALGALALLPVSEPLHVLAGPGNNGGDALALARLARLQGRSVEVWTLAKEPVWRGDAALQARLWEGLGETYRFAEDPASVVPELHGWVVDGLFGLGGRLPLKGLAAAWVEALTRAGAKVLALDQPTGLDPSTPEVEGPVLTACRTACFGHLKICHGLYPAKACCGEITVVPIPLPPQAPRCGMHLLDRPEVRQAAWDRHKREAGHVAIRAGSMGMSGAAVLAALGALRMGAGLVTVLPDSEVHQEIAVQVPEAMVRPWEGRVPEGADVLLVGPGGIKDIPVWSGPLILDASALQTGEGARWMARPETVITPHTGEFCRLFGGSLSRVTSERIARAREAAEGPGILVLKGAQTVVAGGGHGDLLVNPTGHPGLSTGGTGDFLAGMVAAQVGRWQKQGGDLRQAVADAVWLHGAAADRLGGGSLLVRELGGSLTAILRELERGEN